MTPEIAAIINAAVQQTASGQEPRKHHLLPKMYLERWAEDGKIRVTHLDEEPQRSYLNNPDKAARETDFYRIDPAGVIGGSPVTFESYLSTIEGNAKPAIEALDDKQPAELSDEHVRNLLLFLAHQFTRSRSFREELRAIAGHAVLAVLGETDDDLVAALKHAGVDSPTDEQIVAQRALRDTLRKNPASLSIGRSAEIYHAGQAAQSITGVLFYRQAVTYATAPRLITCDDPVVEVYENMGGGSAGLWGAPFLIFPLSPTRVLALIRHDLPIMLEPGTELTVRETLDLNSVLLGNTDRLAFERPSNKLTEKLYVPTKPLAVQLENLGPVDANRSQLLRLRRPRRWQGTPQAPVRPVARWWPKTVPPPRYPDEAQKAVLDTFRPPL